MILAAVYFGAAANVHAGTITGDITFVDSPPKMAPMKVTKDQDYCGETLPDESSLVDANARLKNVVVFLEAAQPAIPADPQKLNVIENSGCRYALRVLAMQKGERLRVKNNDPKLHIPHSYLNEKPSSCFPSRSKIRSFMRRRRSETPEFLNWVCDTHAWMLGFVHVFDHPFFAVTDDKELFPFRMSRPELTL
jgi:hypothetical protein